MTRIRLLFWGLCLGLTALWLAADPFWAGKHPFQQVQFAFINYTGIIAMGTMAVSMLLALRSVAFEPYVGGLDKSYRLHKWLGVAALVMAIAHYGWISAPGWLTAAGVMARPARGATPRGAPPAGGLLHALQGPARGVGSWGFWLTVLLVVLALVKWFPYRHFLRTHRLLAIVYLLLVFHSLVLMKPAYWTHAIAYVVAALLAAGSAAAIWILFRRVGRTRQAVGEIEKVVSHQDGRVLEVRVCLKDRWPGHDAGQFAFVTFSGDEPHPFTISSDWRDDGNLTFLIKELGDYTGSLRETLAAGRLATVEGPYGQFTFGGQRPRQLWISAGIGITPFVSRMQELTTHPDGKLVDLYHSTARRDPEPLRQLQGLADEARVRLHVWVGEEQGRLTAAHILEQVPDFREADVWFCGPVDFGTTLRRDLVAHGLPSSAFHQELFHLR